MRRLCPRCRLQALIEYSSLLGDQADSVNAVDRESTGTTFDAARARAQDLVRTAGVSQSASDLSLSKAMVDIEQAYFQRYEEAFRSEISALGDRAQDQGDESSTQDYQAIGTFLSGVFGVMSRSSKLIQLLWVSLKSRFSSIPGAQTMCLKPSSFAWTAHSIILVPRSSMSIRYYRCCTTMVFAYREFMRLSPRAAYSVRHHCDGTRLCQNVGSAFSFPEPNPAMASRIAARLSEIHCVPVQGFHGVLKGSDQDPEQQLAAELISTTVIGQR